LITSPKVIENDKELIRNAVKNMIELLPNRMDLNSGYSVLGNDLAMIALHLKKIEIQDNIKEVFIFLENQLIENLDKIYLNCLFLII
jgi:hypothetical protein